MPLIKTQCSGELSAQIKSKLASDLSKICSTVMKKPESYVMGTVQDGLTAMMGGRSAACAFVEVKGIGGFSPAVNKKLSAEICSCIEKAAGIQPSCVYINFTDVPGSSWGWNGDTF